MASCRFQPAVYPYVHRLYLRASQWTSPSPGASCPSSSSTFLLPFDHRHSAFAPCCRAFVHVPDSGLRLGDGGCCDQRPVLRDPGLAAARGMHGGHARPEKNGNASTASRRAARAAFCCSRSALAAQWRTVSLACSWSSRAASCSASRGKLGRQLPDHVAVIAMRH